MSVLNSLFEVKEYTGGSEEGFPVEAVLVTDEEATHCSSAGVGQLLSLGLTAAAGGAVVVEKVVVRAPIRGFGEPLRSGVVWVEDAPVGVGGVGTDPARYSAYDDADVDEAHLGRDDPMQPLFFLTDASMEAVVTLHPPRTAQTVRIKFLDSHNSDSNIDVTFIALIGRAAGHSLPSEMLPGTDVSRVERARVLPLHHFAACPEKPLYALGEVLHCMRATALLVVVTDDVVLLQKAVTVRNTLAAKTQDVPATLAFCHTPVGSQEDRLLQAQLGNPAGERIVVVGGGGGGYMMGEEGEDVTLAVLEGFAAQFVKQTKPAEEEEHCSGSGCCGHTHDDPHHHEEKAEEKEEKPTDLTQWVASQQGRVCCVFNGHAHCGVSCRSLPLVKTLLAGMEVALLTVEAPPGLASVPSITVYHVGKPQPPVLQFAGVDEGAAVLDVAAFAQVMRTLLPERR